jgi:hypothetical protein
LFSRREKLEHHSLHESTNRPPRLSLPVTYQKVDSARCDNDCKKRAYLMKGQYFVVSCFAEAQQTARNDHEHKK